VDSTSLLSMSTKIVTVDVREDLNRGREPFAKIMQAVERLKKKQGLRLIAPFEPVPLFPIMSGKGFSHRSKAMPEGDWEILYTREPDEKLIPATAAPSRAKAENCPCGCGRNLIEVDARGLEPPQPLVKILEALAQISGDTELKARTDRRPLHLYAHLDERGFVGRTDEEKDGSFATYIHRCKN
jgi:uncharacterized protein (DUF2249 family)